MTELNAIELRPTGTKGKYRSFIWQACPKCGKPRWVMLVTISKRKTKLCRSCASRMIIGHKAMEESPNWKGGRYKLGGYIIIRLHKDDFFAPMASSNQSVLEHRLVVAKHLGRCLQSWEVVHHRNHKRDDNRIENLQLVTDDRHKQISILERKISNLQNRIIVLEVENTRLEKQMQDLLQKITWS